MQKFYLLLFLVMFNLCGYTQNYVFQHLTTNDGLLTERVTGILHDSKGFTWVGTSKGLQRFDGNKFTTIPFDEDYYYKSTVSLTIFVPLLEDNKGNIWVKINGTAAVYEPLTGKIRKILIKDEIQTTGRCDIYTLCKDGKGDVWIATTLSVYKYNSHSHTVSLLFTYGKGVLFSGNLIYDKFKYGFWMTLNGQIAFFDINKRKLDSKLPHFLPEIVSGITCSWMDSRRNLWLGEWSGYIYKINTVNHKKQVYVMQKAGAGANAIEIAVTSFSQDRKGGIWLGTYYGGLFYYDEQNNKFREVSGDSKLPNSLHYDFDITSLGIDREDNIWVGSDKGVSIFNPSRQQIQTIDENNSLHPFPKTQVSQIFQTSTGDILIGTWGTGWFIYDRNFIFKKHIDFTSFVDRQDYRKSLVWSFAEANDGKIWIGYQHGLISIYDTVSKKISYLDEPGFKTTTVRIIRRDAKGNLWFGLQSGYLGKWDMQKKTFIFYDNIIAEKPNKVHAPITDILIGSDGGIWLATDYYGLYHFNPVKEIFTHQYASGNVEPFDTIINSLTLLDDSIIGVSTAANGFQLINRLRKTVTSFTKKNGLPTNEIYGIAQDKKKNIWMSTIDGLYQKTNKNNEIVSFGKEDGLLNGHFKSRIFVTRDGKMVLPTTTGFIFFTPEEFTMAQTPPRIRLTGFKIFDQSLLIDSLLNVSKTVYLQYDQNFITIEYSALSFSSRNSTRYFYQLDGVDKGWVNAGLLKSASYTGLNPGHYFFKVKSVNREGIGSKNSINLEIYITPPWWRTPWAYTFYGTILCATIYFIYRSRTRSLQSSQRAEIKAIVATQEGERKRISRDLHDDVGTKLSALKLFISSLYEKARNSDNAEMKSLAKSCEQFITEVMQDVRRLLVNLSPTVLEEFGYSVAVEAVVNKINETKQINFNLVVFGMNDRMQKDYELALYRITQELINNVLKHADAKNVALQIGQRDNKIILMIEDDGKGFDINVHKDGYGLRNLDARTKLLHGTIIIDSTPGKGTSVLIEIPYNINYK